MATKVYWDGRINTRVIREGTSWNDIEGFIEDKTLSGKTKRRLSASMTKRVFSVKFIFNLEEYELFQNWYKQSILYGSVSFLFPQIDTVGGDYKEYRIASGGAPNYSNRSGRIIECTMTWEEV